MGLVGHYHLRSRYGLINHVGKVYPWRTKKLEMVKNSWWILMSTFWGLERSSAPWIEGSLVSPRLVTMGIGRMSLADMVSPIGGSGGWGKDLKCTMGSWREDVIQHLAERHGDGVGIAWMAMGEGAGGMAST